LLHKKTGPSTIELSSQGGYIVRIQLCLALAVSLFSTFAEGASESQNEKTSESKIVVDEVTSKRNKVAGDIDQEITNAKLRADSGSKSKFSVSTTANYRGGSVSRPFGMDRPDLSGLPDNQVDTSLDGSVRMRYRPDKNTNYSVGITLGVKTPFHGDMNENENQLNVGDPMIGRNRTFAAWGLQNSWNLLASVGTSDEAKNIDRVGSVATDYTLMKKFDRLSLGATASVWYDILSSEPGEHPRWRQRAGMQKVDRRTQWGGTFSPTVEYQISDKLTFRALFAYFRWKHLYGDNENWRMLRIKEYNSVGVGVALIRDVYLYPNVQFLPRDAKMDNTNVGLSATLNVF